MDILNFRIEVAYFVSLILSTLSTLPKINTDKLFIIILVYEKIWIDINPYLLIIMDISMHSFFNNISIYLTKYMENWEGKGDFSVGTYLPMADSCT